MTILFCARATLTWAAKRNPATHPATAPSKKVVVLESTYDCVLLRTSKKSGQCWSRTGIKHANEKHFFRACTQRLKRCKTRWGRQGHKAGFALEWPVNSGIDSSYLSKYLLLLHFFFVRAVKFGVCLCVFSLSVDILIFMQSENSSAASCSPFQWVFYN